jgi:hypothetical protein
MSDEDTAEFEYEGPTVPNNGSPGKVFITMAAKRLREIADHIDAIGDYFDELSDAEILDAWTGVEDRSRELVAAGSDLQRFSGAQRRRAQAIEDAK